MSVKVLRRAIKAAISCSGDRRACTFFFSFFNLLVAIVLHILGFCFSFCLNNLNYFETDE